MESNIYRFHSAIFFQYRIISLYIPNDCSMDFVLVGIVCGLGYATLTIYMT